MSEEIERELVLLFRRVRSFHFTIAAQVHPGLDPASYGLLGIIHDSAEPLRGADLVERLGLDKSTISRQLAQLVELGMAERVADPEDARVRLVQLTERGVAELRVLRDERHRRLRARFERWCSCSAPRTCRCCVER